MSDRFPRLDFLAPECVERIWWNVKYKGQKDGALLLVVGLLTWFKFLLKVFLVCIYLSCVCQPGKMLETSFMLCRNSSGFSLCIAHVFLAKNPVTSFLDSHMSLKYWSGAWQSVLNFSLSSKFWMVVFQINNTFSQVSLEACRTLANAYRLPSFSQCLVGLIQFLIVFCWKIHNCLDCADIVVSVQVYIFTVGWN